MRRLKENKKYNKKMKMKATSFNVTRHVDLGPVLGTHFVFGTDKSHFSVSFFSLTQNVRFSAMLCSAVFWLRGSESGEGTRRKIFEKENIKKNKNSDKKRRMTNVFIATENMKFEV